MGGGTSSWGYHGGSGVGVGVRGIPLGGGPLYSDTFEIVMGKGRRPDDPNAYDAHEVVRAIRP